MADTLTKVLVMSFEADANLPGSSSKSKTIRVAYPANDITPEKVYGFMKFVCDKALFWEDEGEDGVGFHPASAKVVTTQTKNLDLVTVE